jgi:ADP-heptose:LPS heptosyltransferase
MIKKFNTEKTKNLEKVNNVLRLFYRKSKKRSANTDAAHYRNILIIDFSLIGDMVMSIPFLKNIRFNCPNAQITLVAMPWSKVILGDQSLVDNFIIFNGKDELASPGAWIKNRKDIRKTLREVNKTHYDIAFEPKGDLRHMLFMRYTNADRTVSYNYTGGDYLVTDCYEPVKGIEHLIDEKLELLRLSGFSITPYVPELKLSDAARDYVECYKERHGLGGKVLIGIHPGASNENKRFGKYPELVERLSKELSKKNRDYTFLLFESPDGESEIKSIIQTLDRTHISYHIIQKSIDKYIQLVSLCNYMICNDSSASHIAAAYSIPTLVIFGAVKSETALPRGKGKVVAVSHDLDCKPCTLPQCPRGTYECIDSITVDECMDGLREIGLIKIHNRKEARA